MTSQLFMCFTMFYFLRKWFWGKFTDEIEIMGTLGTVCRE